MPKWKVDIPSIEYGYPNPQPLFRGDKKEKGYLYVTAPNMFVAENKANELYAKIYGKNPKKVKKFPFYATFLRLTVDQSMLY